MEATTFLTSFARLTKRREQLLTTLRHLDDEQAQVERNTDWVDEAAFDSRVALLDGLRHEYLAEMHKIDRALERIEKKEYGKCAACRAPIDAKRLELVPETEHCYACAEFREEFEQYAA
jgi:DnaK suppressor protein